MKNLIFCFLISFILSAPVNIQAQNDSDFDNYQMGRKNYSEGKYLESINFLNKYLKVHQDNYQAYLLRGDSYRQLGQNNNALNDYSKAILLSPKTVALYVRRASVYDSLKQYENELGDFIKAIQIDPKNSELFLYRGVYFSDSAHKNPDKAIKDFEKAIVFDPKNIAAYEKKGLINFESKHFDDALTDFNQAINLGSKNWIVFSKRGAILIRKNEFDKAILDFNSAIEIINKGQAFDKRMGDPFYNRGTIYLYNVLDSNKALEDFDKAINYNPDIALYYKSRGSAYVKLGNIEKAKENYIKAIEIDHALKEQLEETLNSLNQD